MFNLMMLRGIVVGDPWYVEDSDTSHFLLAFTEGEEEPTPESVEVLYQVHCRGQLASQVEAVVYHADPVVVLGTVRPAPVYGPDRTKPAPLAVDAITVGHDLALTTRTPTI